MKNIFHLKFLVALSVAVVLPYTHIFCMEPEQAFAFAVPAPIVLPQEGLAPQQEEPATPATPITAAAAMELAQLANTQIPAAHKLYTCAVCHAVVDGYQAFLKHKYSHKDSLPYVCTQAGCE